MSTMDKVTFKKSPTKKDLEFQKMVRYRLIRPHRRRNALLGVGIFGIIAGIYAYSILSVRQEKFLDEEFEKKSQT